MNDERYVRKGYNIWDTYSDRKVQELNYRSQSDYMCEVLNEKEAIIQRLELENEQLRRGKELLRDERRLQEKFISYLFDEVNKLNKENENLKRDHRIMEEKLYIISKDYIKDVRNDDEC